MQKPGPKSTLLRKTIAMTLLLSVTLGGCRPDAPEVTPKGPEVTVSPGKTIAFHANAKRAVTYKWALQGPGQIADSEGETTLYSGPQESGIAILTVTAHNVWGTSPPTGLTIRPAAFAPLDALAKPLVVVVPPGGDEDSVDWKGSPGNCHSGSDCLRFTYRPGAGYSGIQWQPLCILSTKPLILSPTPSWPYYTAVIVPGGECSIDVLKAGNLSEVSYLSFWVRGEKSGEIVEFGLGGPNAKPIPGGSTGEITLQSAWERREIDLASLDLTEAIVLFRWYATGERNPDGAIFCLDDIRFEGVRQVH